MSYIKKDGVYFYFFFFFFFLSIEKEKERERERETGRGYIGWRDDLSRPSASTRFHRDRWRREAIGAVDSS